MYKLADKTVSEHLPIPAYECIDKNILAKMADCVTNQKISLKSVDYQTRKYNF